jgi:general secretion pathway protein I
MQKQRAFTLIEVLVAFTIMAMSVGLLLEVFTRSTTSVIRSQAYTQAARIAQSQLARVGSEIKIEDGQETGETDSKFRWKVDIHPFEIDFIGNFQAWDVQVEVERDDIHYLIKTMRINKK